MLPCFTYPECCKTSCLLRMWGSLKEMTRASASFYILNFCKGQICVCVYTDIYLSILQNIMSYNFIISEVQKWKCSCVCFLGTWWGSWLTMGSCLMMLLSRAAILYSCAVSVAFPSSFSKILLHIQQSQQASHRYGIFSSICLIQAIPRSCFV